MKILLSFWKTIIWVVFMLVLFLVPSKDIPGSIDIPYLDKIVHMSFFMVLTMLFVRDRLKYSGLKTILPRHILIVFLLVLCFAVTVEFLQEIMNLGREGDIVDILCDLVGFMVGILVMIVLSLPRYRSL